MRACPKYWTHRRKRCGRSGERYMTDSELAGHLKLTRRTLAEYRITGKLPYYKVGGKLLYKEKDILMLLERNRMEAFDYR